MLLQEDKPEQVLTIREYRWPTIEFTNASHRLPLVFTADRVHALPLPKRFDEMTQTLWHNIFQIDADIILCGTGNTHRFLPIEMENTLAGKTIDCMHNAAVCRTFTLLTSEYRSVVAVVFEE